MSDLSVSIEVPVFKGGFLRPCVESVLAQTSEAWTLSLVWDGGDRQSFELLEALQREGHPRVRIYFTENQGIAAARRFLTDRSSGAYLLPLDDNDILAPHAVERFLQFAGEHPWASLIRARRGLIDTKGAPAEEGPVFPFSPRHYWRGMVTDLFNQAQPYIIRRSAYQRTKGWRGFADFMGAGEDCDIFLQLEEVAHFELIDEILYYYRMHESRASLDLTAAGAYEMWRRLADDTVARLGLPLQRSSEAPPFRFRDLPVSLATVRDVEFVIEGDPAAQLGVADDAIHVGTDFPSTGKPLVCFVPGGVAIVARRAIEELAQVMNRTRADLVIGEAGEVATTQSGSGFRGVCLLRREVIAATGGWDTQWVAPELLQADLWLQARRRDFRCVRATVEGISGTAKVSGQANEGIGALRKKWASYPKLLAELALVSGETDLAAG